MIDAEQLLTLLEVAEQGSITEAAKRLHRGQSTISERLKHLTDYVGEPLYERDGNGVRLTAIGTRLLEDMKRLRRTMEDIDSIVTRRKALQDGKLYIFSTNLITNYFLLPYILEFKSLFPRININIKSSEKYTPDIPAGLLDIFFYEEEIPMPYIPDYYESRAWKEDDIVFGVAPGNALSQEPVIDVRMLADETIIWRDTMSAVRRAAERQFTNANMTPKHTIEVGDIETVGFMVQAGLGVGFFRESLHNSI